MRIINVIIIVVVVVAMIVILELVIVNIVVVGGLVVSIGGCAVLIHHGLWGGSFRHFPAAAATTLGTTAMKDLGQKVEFG